ncbi:MAG: four helix bundle protein, partial [Candidatus Omnitrophica bacterium]|nr:four helix bundle protein [Candidatus Omnitrophota bacterium]
MQNFKDLKIWQKSVELVEKIYKITKDFPKEEQYSLSMQIKRASVSIPSNIAEGFRRKHNKEYKQFLYIALGSCAELETQLIIANKLDYIKDGQQKELSTLIDYICRMI